MSQSIKQQLPQPVSDLEWTTRCRLAAVYRIAEHFGWTDLINTHLSARIPEEPDTFLINRHGETFGEVTASSLLKMDMSGRVLGTPGPINEAGFTIHSAVYDARPDAMCVLHTHTPAGAGVSLFRNGLRPISQDALHVLDDVAYHPYGVPASQDEFEALQKSCERYNSIILLNHGLLTLAPSIHGAFYRLYRLERACQLELIARSSNEAPLQVDQDVIEKAAVYMPRLRAAADYGLLEFEAMVRMLARNGADYCR